MGSPQSIGQLLSLTLKKIFGGSCAGAEYQVELATGRFLNMGKGWGKDANSQEPAKHVCIVATMWKTWTCVCSVATMRIVITSTAIGDLCFMTAEIVVLAS